MSGAERKTHQILEPIGFPSSRPLQLGPSQHPGHADSVSPLADIGL